MSEVLRGPVSIGGIHIGDPVDVFFDSELRSLIGLEVLCRDGIHRFLPWAVSEAGPDGLSLSFSLALLDRPQLDYYREHALTLSLLRRLPFESHDGPLPIDDVLAGSRGHVVAVLVERFDEHVAIGRDQVAVERDRLRYLDAVGRVQERAARAAG